MCGSLEIAIKVRLPLDRNFDQYNVRLFKDEFRLESKEKVVENVKT